VVDTIPVGLRPPNSAFLGLAITPDGTGVYVANGGGNTLSVISTASNTVTGSITVGNGPIALAFAPSGFVFSSFTAKLGIAAPGFVLDGSFKLATGAPALTPATQAMTLTVGTYTVTLPAGSFRAGPLGIYSYAGVVNKVGLTILLTPTGKNAYNIAVGALGVNLTKLTYPVTVTLTIGNNTGSTGASKL
jgi:YVTN family beta-propeller protein